MTHKEEVQLHREARQKAEAERIAGMRLFERRCAALRPVSGEEKVVIPAGAEPEREPAEGLVICGIDEAGRGPLAGPVAAGAVILPEDSDLLYINDSKKLSAHRREELYDRIRSEAIAWNVGLVGPERIDEINILQATYEAMRLAVEGLRVQPDVLLIDAVHIPGMKLPQVSVIKGDARCYSIAAASILAKVTRDRLMLEYDRQYPEYGFSSHKGYGTAAHIAALRQYGPCPIHRRSFIKSFVG